MPDASKPMNFCHGEIFDSRDAPGPAAQYREVIVSAQAEIIRVVTRHLEAPPLIIASELAGLKNALERFAGILGLTNCFFKRCSIHRNEGKIEIRLKINSTMLPKIFIISVESEIHWARGFLNNLRLDQIPMNRSLFDERRRIVYYHVYLLANIHLVSEAQAFDRILSQAGLDMLELDILRTSRMLIRLEQAWATRRCILN